MKKVFSLLFVISLASCSVDNSNIQPIQPLPGAVFGTDEYPLNVGGSNEQNQVYVDLKTTEANTVARDSWDFGFYSGEGFHVVINGSLAMAVKQLETTDITLAQSQDLTVAVGTFDPNNMAYIDNPHGYLTETAFGTLATSEAEAKVYLVNMGYTVPTVPAAAGSVNVAGASRGWKKVKIWVEGEAYKIQFAELKSAAYTENTIAKEPLYNHTFFSMTANATVKAEPVKADWDMVFTTFTNEVFSENVSSGSYFFADYVLINSKAGVTAIKIEGDGTDYKNFSLATLETGDFAFSDDQRVVGENWRNVIDKVVFSNVFFVIKDSEDNYYKVKFISMVSSAGERGFPVFEYETLK
jgi:hypothetical protein